MSQADPEEKRAIIKSDSTHEIETEEEREAAQKTNVRRNFCCRHKFKIIGLSCLVFLCIAIPVSVVMYLKYRVREFDFANLGIANCSSIPNDANALKLDHSLWDEVLRANVKPDQEKNGIKFSSFNYHAVRRDQSTFNDYLKYLEEVPISGMSCNEQKALWTNSYNALAVSIMIQNGIPASIRDIASATSEVWNMKAGNVGGAEYTLNEIEKGILLSILPDARLHAVVNCASLSCPDLRGEAYTGDKMEAQLDDQSRLWMADPTKGAKITAQQTLISKLFFWYGDDFVRVYNSSKGFIDTFGDFDEEVSAGPYGSDNFMDYNWNRNEVDGNDSHADRISVLVPACVSCALWVVSSIFF